MNCTQYLVKAGLAHDAVDTDKVDQLILHLTKIAQASRESPLIDSDTLYQYSVPLLGAGGSCSLIDEIDPILYDLSKVLGGRTESTSRALLTLAGLIKEISDATDAAWLGIYARRTLQDGSEALVKLAYQGKASRAEFPLTPEFALHSNNSSVGLTGKAIVIEDIESWVASGGAYYTCDAEVRSEACLPLLNAAGKVVGIIDAEDSRVSWFKGECMNWLVALCIVVPLYLPE